MSRNTTNNNNNNKNQMAAQIVPFPSLAHGLSSLQYATSMQNLPIHQSSKGRFPESEAKLRNALQNQTSPPQGYYVPRQGSQPTSEYLTMRSSRH